MNYPGLGALLSIPALLAAFCVTNWSISLVSGWSPTDSATPGPASDVTGPDIRPADGMPMIQVPAGDFAMGSPNWQGRRNQQPRHKVTLDEYWIDKFEVSNAQYRLCVTAGACPHPLGWQRVGLDGDQQPVVGVDWFAAGAYCAWAGARLPTEAEWEKAARGTDSRLFPWGNQEPDCSRAQYMHCAGWQTLPTGSFPAGASPYGVLDMAGNAWEWTADWYEAEFYAQSPADNPSGPPTGEYRVARGGSRISNARHVETSYRYRFSPEFSIDRKYATLIGFRCAR